MPTPAMMPRTKPASTTMMWLLEAHPTISWSHDGQRVTLIAGGMERTYQATPTIRHLIRRYA